MEKNTDKPFLIIAVDGGAAAGKSSTSRALAAKFGLLHVDTGMHYRAVTHCLQEAHIAPLNTPAIVHYLQHIPMGTIIRDTSAFVAINGTIPEAALLRSEKVNSLVSAYAALPEIRHYLLNYQRGHAAVAEAHGFKGLIMEGRDIGSIVFPDATLAFFLEADVNARSLRRQNDDFGNDDIRQRDKTDSMRKAAPLSCPPHAIKIDSTHLPLETVVEQMSEKISAFI